MECVYMDVITCKTISNAHGMEFALKLSITNIERVRGGTNA